jgi:hypothetical protein
VKGVVPAEKILEAKMPSMVLRSLCAAMVTFFLCAATQAVETQPFAGFNGVWTGGGYVKLSNGTQERIRCRATYVEGDRGTALQQSLRCASDSYNFELRSDIESHGSQVSGSWNEITRNIGGTLSGRAQPGRFELRVNNPSFNADLTLVSRENEQSVTIRSVGTQFAGATVSLRRSARSVTDRDRLSRETVGGR